jgi:hypothetical protein
VVEAADAGRAVTLVVNVVIVFFSSSLSFLSLGLNWSQMLSVDLFLVAKKSHKQGLTRMR